MNATVLCPVHLMYFVHGETSDSYHIYIQTNMGQPVGSYPMKLNEHLPWERPMQSTSSSIVSALAGWVPADLAF